MNAGNPEHYDLIVVGSGIGGLTSAGLLAAAGYSVLVVEQHDRPGGYVHGFRRKRYRFDSAVHLTSGCGPEGYRGGQIIHKTLKALGVHDELDFDPVDPIAVAVYPGLCVALPQTVRALVQKMAGIFPSEQEGLTKFIDLSRRIASEASNADEILAGGSPAGLSFELPALLRYRRATLAAVCSEFLDNPELIAVLTASWPYLGLPPSRLSYVYWATMFIGYLEDGACYCRGSFQRFADALVAGLERNGGKILFKSAVERIRIQDGQVHGVTLDDGRNYISPRVIANSDMRRTVFDLVGREYFPKRFVQRMDSLKPSLSIFVVYLATDLRLEDLQVGHESFCYADFDHDANYRNSCQGKVSWIGISIPTLTDPTLAPRGQHLVMLTTLVPYEIDRSWKHAKSDYVSAMVEIAERVLPGLKDHVLYIEGGSPKTMERYTWNSRGAAYGWALSPDQVGPNRIPNRSAIEGLYFAGHWTTPGGGVYGAAVSGVLTAKTVLGIAEDSLFWKRFGPHSGASTADSDTETKIANQT